MKGVVRGIGVAGMLSLVAACGTTRTFVDYNRAGLYSTDTVGNVPYVEVGPALASERGFFWEGCEAMAARAVEKLRLAADQRGANSVTGVRWLNQADGTYSERPTCTTGWGWFAVVGVGGFMPWVKATELEGQLVYAQDANLARLRGEVDQRSQAWQAREARIVAHMQARDSDRATAEAALAAQEAADAAAAAAAVVAAERAAAEKAAAQRAAAERAAASQGAAPKPTARKTARKRAAGTAGTTPQSR